MKKFNEILHNAMLDSGTKPRDLAKSAKVQVYKIHEWVGGDSLPNNYQLKLIASCLGLEYRDLESMLLFGHELTPVRQVSKYKNINKMHKEIIKPGVKKKETKIKNTKRQHDIKISGVGKCTSCDIEKGTERICHAESTMIKMLSGGGIIGNKIDDNLTARLCYECDIELSTKPDKDSPLVDQLSHEVKWWRAIAKSHLI